MPLVDHHVPRPVLARRGVSPRPRSAVANAVSLAAGLALLVGTTNPFTIRLVGLMPISEIVLLTAGTVVLLQIVLTHRMDAPAVRTPACSSATAAS